METKQDWVDTINKYGGLAERSIASVLKTEDVERHPGVRIPKPPQKSWDTNPRFFFRKITQVGEGACLLNK